MESCIAEFIKRQFAGKIRRGTTRQYTIRLHSACVRQDIQTPPHPHNQREDDQSQICAHHISTPSQGRAVHCALRPVTPWEASMEPPIAEFLKRQLAYKIRQDTTRQSTIRLHGAYVIDYRARVQFVHGGNLHIHAYNPYVAVPA